MPIFEPARLAEWSGGAWSSDVPAPVRGICHDTRALRSGDLYVAIRGERHDGHTFLEEAARCGACAALVDTAYAASATAPLPLLVVPDTRPALMALAAGYRATLDLPVIGITGSVGKTTVKELTADVFDALAPTFRNPGNWNNQVGLPLSVLRLDASHRHGVFELGINHPGEMQPLCDVLQPTAGILTEIGPVHIEYFPSERAIADEKSVLFRSLDADAHAVISADNPWFEVARDAYAGTVTTVSFRRDADYVGEAAADDPSAFQVRERSSGESHRFTAALPGAFFREDALLTIALARRAGVAWPALEQAVAAYRPQPMRWNVRTIAGRTVVDDSYNANPVSMRAALKTFNEMDGTGRKWLVLGGMLELGDRAPELHRELGRRVADTACAGLIAYGPWGKRIADGAREAGYPDACILECASHRDACLGLLDWTREHDAILLKASRGERLERILPLLAERLGDSPSAA